jgi:hypothetical protein
MNTDKIKNRIKALLAKAESTQHPAEREAFTAKAHELLNEYQLDLGELIDAEDPVDVTRGDVRGWVPSWEISLMVAVARYYGCRPVTAKGHGRRTDGTFGATIRVDYVGRESARVTADLMFQFIRSQVMAAGRELFKADPSRPLGRHQRDVGNALVIRIQQLMPKAEQDAADSGVNALVPVDRIEAMLAELYPDLTKGRVSKIGSTGKARKAADGVSLHRQAGGSSALRIGRA